ncbi:MAG: 3-oxoacid CoA-transferase [Candidatus Krumholzibacteria bacterium]|nr:3-oxoacid CoA-transferase [Candidatus Krumholzibacteria bacterium]
MENKGYSENELLICVASKLLEDKTSALVGTGLPMLAGMLAQKTHAPGLLIIFEAGGIGPIMPTLPISVGDSRTFHRAIAASSMHDVMSFAQAGYVDFGFLGAAQLDKHGNINTTVIGDHDHPKARLPGSGGANDVGSFARRTIIIIRQDKKRLVEKCDFITTPGYLDGPGARERAGLPKNSGPYRVITQLGVFDFNGANKTMRLIAMHPGVTVADVEANTSFEIEVAPHLETTAPPTAREIEILHREIDPAGIVLKK